MEKCNNKKIEGLEAKIAGVVGNLGVISKFSKNQSVKFAERNW